MSKFTFINEQFEYDEYTGEEGRIISKSTREFHGHTLESVLDEITSFLRGAGYHFDGHLDVVPFDYEIQKLDKQIDDLNSQIAEERSSRVMSHMVDDLLKNPISVNPLSAVDDYSGSGDEELYLSINDSFDFTDYKTPIGAADTTFNINLNLDDINLTLNDHYDMGELTLKEENCSICKLPLSIMTSHKCFDERCPMNDTNILSSIGSHSER
jgi:hypothetical protein